MGTAYCSNKCLFTGIHLELKLTKKKLSWIGDDLKKRAVCKHVFVEG